MLYFDCDYNNGMHPAILKRFSDTNALYSGTYGFDAFSDSARTRIRAACGDPAAEVFFLAGGTQSNATVIDCLLKPWEGAVAAESGHINVHESGAVEYTGHKVSALPSHDGKIDAAELSALLQAYAGDDTRDHMVRPGLLYISQPTEVGTLYSAAELSEIWGICRKSGVKLYVDGARLGYALGSPANDVTLPFLAGHCDAFYIGGTKVGAICGEAVVFPRGGAPEHFFTRIKQHGALLAKGRLVGLQFDTLFTDGLYEEIGRGAVALALRLREIFTSRGYRAWTPSPTNQQFIILPHNVKEKLASAGVMFEKWCPYDTGNDVCRFVTSWATTPSDLDGLESLL